MKRLAMTLAATLAAVVANAKTTTWTGGSSGLFSADANWSDGAPGAGDTATFTKSVTITAERFDLAGNLTLDVQGSAVVLTSRTQFGGTGDMTKTGDGQWLVMTNLVFAGNAYIKKGQLRLCNRPDQNGGWQFGTGTVYLDHAAGATIQLWQWTAGLDNPLEITCGTSTSAAILLNNPNFFPKRISGDGDVYIYNNQNYGYFNLTGGLCSPGHTFYLDYHCGGDYASASVLSGEINASVTINATKNSTFRQMVTFTGRGLNTTDTMTICRGTNVFTHAATWVGNIVVNGAYYAQQKAVLAFSGEADVRCAKVAVNGGGKVAIPSGQTISVSSLTDDGETIAEGTYTKATLPEILEGDGTLVVRATRSNVWGGGASGSFAESANWSAGAVQGGDILYVTNAVTFAQGEFELAEGQTYELENTADVTLGVTFTGAGRFVKGGSSAMSISGNSSHTGGTVITGGRLDFNNRYATAPKLFGTGEIELDEKRYGNPRLYFGQWDAGLANVVRVKNVRKSGSLNILASSNPFRLTGKLIVEKPCRIDIGWGGGNILGGIESVNGATVDIVSNGGYYDKSYPDAYHLAGPIDASVNVSGQCPLHYDGTCTNAALTYTVNSAATGTNIFASAATWAGKVAVGANGRVLLCNAGNLGDAAAVSLAKGGKVILKDGARCRAGSLTLGGTVQPYGNYTASNRPDYFAGTGRLRVGTPGFAVVFR